MISKIKLAIWSAALAMVFSVGVAKAQKIRIAISNPDMSFLSGGVAQFKGFFREQGLDVELIQMNANVSIAALAAGNIDYNLILQSIVTGNLRGLPIKVVGILIERPNHVAVVNPRIKTYSDLRGRKIAVSSFGSLTDILARLTTEHFHLDPSKDVQFVAAGSSSARVAQLQSGLVDACFISPPANIKAESLGFKSLVHVRDILVFPVNGVGVNQQKLKSHRAEIKKVLRALLKANRFILNDRKGSIEILSQWGRTSPKIAAEAYDATAANYSRDLLVSEQTLERVIQSTKLNIHLKREVPLNEVFDLSMAREVLKEMSESPK